MIRRGRSCCSRWRLAWVVAGAVIVLTWEGAGPAAAGSLRDDLGRLNACSAMLSGPHDATTTAPASSGERVPAIPGTRTALRSLIVLYQLTLSSQDTPACNYEPTCSHFAQEAIRSRGPILGILMTSDRLQRCIGAARRYYPTDPLTSRALDPVQPPPQSSR